MPHARNRASGLNSRRTPDAFRFGHIREPPGLQFPEHDALAFRRSDARELSSGENVNPSTNTLCSSNLVVRYSFLSTSHKRTPKLRVATATTSPDGLEATLRTASSFWR